MDYECEKGAKRNFEPWREAKLAEETEQERLDRLEREEGEHDAMVDLEGKAVDAKTEMAIADSLDKIRTRNARLERTDRAGEVAMVVADDIDDARRRLDEHDAEVARQAFLNGTGERVRRLQLDPDGTESMPHDGQDIIDPGPSLDEAQKGTPSFVRTVKKKKDFGAALGIKKKTIPL